MEMNYCRRCGAALSKISDSAFICDNTHRLYVNGIATVSVFFVSSDNRVLLSVRGIEPHKGMLDSVGGFVDTGESLEEAAIREIKEEIGLNPDEYEPLQYICSAANDYPFDGEIVSIVGVSFVSRLRPTAVPSPADDVADVKYVPINDIDMSQIGNDDVRFALQKLKESLI